MLRRVVTGLNTQLKEIAMCVYPVYDAETSQQLSTVISTTLSFLWAKLL